MGSEVLTAMQLNRATLARQMLLERAPVVSREAIRHLLALQAQEPRPPFLALWTRIEGFRRDDLRAVIDDRAVVRATMMRATLHLMDATDYATFRPTVQPALTQAVSVLRGRADGLDVESVVAEARAFFANGPAPFDSVRDHLERSNPDRDIRAAAYIARLHLPLIQMPGPGPWGYPSNTPFMLAEPYLSRDLETDDHVDELVLRYLAAFGPASAADMQSWTGLAKLSPVFERLRPKLVTFRDEKRRDLFDLPGAPRPNGETPAPVRFLPDFDNVLLGYADRSRIIADEHRRRVITANLRVLAVFLVDGFVAGTWKIERKKAAATLLMQPFAKLAPATADELAAEGEKLVGFAEPDAKAVDIRFEAVA